MFLSSRYSSWTDAHTDMQNNYKITESFLQNISILQKSHKNTRKEIMNNRICHHFVQGQESKSKCP